MVVGVACGSDLLIYKNNKPFYKFSVPSLPILALEQDAWQKLSEPDTDSSKIIENLKNTPFGLLSPRSQTLVNLPQEDIKEFIEKYSSIHLTKSSPITCMTSLKRNSEDPLAISCPVLATEQGQVYVLDPQSFTILHEAHISNAKATPSIIRASGILDIEFRIIVACREMFITLLRRGWLEGKIIIQTVLPIVDMILMPGDNFICAATTDKMLHCYTKRGNKLWSVKMNQPITCLCLIPLKHLSIALVAVGMQGGAIHLYHSRHSVDFITAPDTPSAIVFGQLGQEEHVMVIITTSGTMNFKILKRTADFNLNRDNSISPAAQSKPLPLPKRSKLFLEQSMRERQHAVDMHQSFQQDLVRLRLIAARTVVQVNSNQAAAGNEKEQLKLSAQVLGLGPMFTLILTLENMNSDKALIELSAVFHCKPSIYKLSSYISAIPLIPPGLAYKIETKVKECLNSENSTEEGAAISTTQIIRVFIVRLGQVQPVLAATINMPPTDPLAYTV
ncbi:hypothetical protein ILUMI_04215 [Ignelater luminosus]|uniref:Bardet-Biedl syndrome 1 N-terminal domain-containing protein n=1 Tax=Ignelater luminosus TaxID=2038154 RepID=A0A8K0GJ86_IGNLU|nr:hypothetical protein ILUMI_04215 [Ignelater luminosus]